MDLPEIGRLAVLQDPTGAVFQILQPPPELIAALLVVAAALAASPVRPRPPRRCT